MARTIAITGKGGTGKTTVAALAIRHLKEHAAGPVLALDADPDANLGTVLAIPVEKSIGDLREETAKEIKNLPPGLSKAAYIEAGLHEIVVETPKVDLITMGRSEGPGCYCYLNSLLRRYAEDLHDAYEWIVMDNEAGLEHLSRRTAASVDHLIVVVTASVLSIDCARRITELVASLKNEVRRKHFIINGARDDKIDLLRQKVEPFGLEYLGHLPQDDALEDQVFQGRSLFELNEANPAVRNMTEIMKKLMED
ncbi:AAA family ATPase [bacterium]|nr:AAA family ATPase [bacterium]